MQRMNPEVFRETHLIICLSTDQGMPVMKPLGSGGNPSKRMRGNSTQGSQRDEGHGQCLSHQPDSKNSKAMGTVLSIDAKTNGCKFDEK